MSKTSWVELRELNPQEEQFTKYLQRIAYLCLGSMVILLLTGYGISVYYPDQIYNLDHMEIYTMLFGAILGIWLVVNIILDRFTDFVAKSPSTLKGVEAEKK